MRPGRKATGADATAGSKNEAFEFEHRLHLLFRTMVTKFICLKGHDEVMNKASMGCNEKER